jgi:tRNA(Arg) A34 adenosine deaminase TadA
MTQSQEELKETSGGVSKQDQRFLDVAIAVAATSDCVQKHGCIIVRHGSIFATGVNKNRNNPLVAPEHATFHAEHDAIRKLRGQDMKGATIYVARLSKLHIPALSRPCDFCYGKIRLTGINRIVHTDWDENANELEQMKISHGLVKSRRNARRRYY